jgi:hypothetical protein
VTAQNLSSICLAGTCQSCHACGCPHSFCFRRDHGWSWQGDWQWHGSGQQAVQQLCGQSWNWWLNQSVRYYGDAETVLAHQVIGLELNIDDCCINATLYAVLEQAVALLLAHCDGEPWSSSDLALALQLALELDSFSEAGSSYVQRYGQGHGQGEKRQQGQQGGSWGGFHQGNDGQDNHGNGGQNGDQNIGCRGWSWQDNCDASTAQGGSQVQATQYSYEADLELVQIGANATAAPTTFMPATSLVASSAVATTSVAPALTATVAESSSAPGTRPALSATTPASSAPTSTHGHKSAASCRLVECSLLALLAVVLVTLLIGA